jgi:hypothetical protein
MKEVKSMAVGRRRISSFEKQFETPRILVRIHMGDGAVRQGNEVYVRRLRFDARDYDPMTGRPVSLGRAYFLSGAVTTRYEQTHDPKDQILRVERVDTGEDVWPRVRLDIGPAL